METLRFIPAGEPEWEEAWRRARALPEATYPEFMRHDPVANERFPRAYAMYPDWQLLAVDGDRVVGFLNSVPLPWQPGDDLPDEGWDWAITAATDRRVAATETACGLQVVVDPAVQGRGYAGRLVARMKRLAAVKGCRRLLLPVRPTRKAEHPRVAMAEYASWTDDRGLPFDPWIRVHVGLGAAIVGPCDRAMTIAGTVAEWTSWTGLDFPETGRYEVPGALAPVAIDLEADRGIYREPNLWMAYRLDDG